MKRLAIILAFLLQANPVHPASQTLRDTVYIGSTSYSITGSAGDLTLTDPNTGSKTLAELSAAFSGDLDDTSQGYLSSSSQSVLVLDNLGVTGNVTLTGNVEFEGGGLQFDVTYAPAGNGQIGWDSTSFILHGDIDSPSGFNTTIRSASGQSVEVVPGSGELSLNAYSNWLAQSDPGTSGAGEGRIWFDTTLNKFRAYENGGSAVDLISAGGSFTGDQDNTTQGFFDATTGAFNIRDQVSISLSGDAPNSGTYSLRQDGTTGLLHQMRTIVGAGVDDGATLLGETADDNLGTADQVDDGQNLFNIEARGFDGIDWLTAAGKIIFEVDGTVGTGQIPGAIRFQVADASSLNDILTLTNNDSTVRVDHTLEISEGLPTPAVSSASEARLYCDGTDLLLSVNGGAYEALSPFTGDLVNNNLSASGLDNVIIIDRCTIQPGDVLATGEHTLNVTGTMPTSNADEEGVYIFHYVSGANNAKVGLSSILAQGDGASPNGFNAAGRFTNQVTGTANSANYGIVAISNGSGSGTNLGGRFQALNAAVNIGAQATATQDVNNATNVGLCVSAVQTLGTNTEIGAWVDMQSGDPSFDRSGALIIDNSARPVSPLVVRDNTSEVWEIIDGGAHEYVGVADPGTSAAGEGRIWFDSTANKFKAYENGGSAVNLISSSTFQGIDILNDGTSVNTSMTSVDFSDEFAVSESPSGRANVSLASKSLAGSDSLTASATTKTVTLASAMPDATYHVSLMCTSDSQGPVAFQAGQLTTTTFDVTVSANTGTLNFTYETKDIP